MNYLDSLPEGVRVTIVCLAVVVAVLVVLAYGYVALKAEDEAETRGINPGERWRVRR